MQKESGPNWKRGEFSCAGRAPFRNADAKRGSDPECQCWTSEWITTAPTRRESEIPEEKLKKFSGNCLFKTAHFYAEACLGSRSCSCGATVATMEKNSAPTVGRCNRVLRRTGRRSRRKRERANHRRSCGSNSVRTSLSTWNCPAGTQTVKNRSTHRPATQW